MTTAAYRARATDHRGEYRQPVDRGGSQPEGRRRQDDARAGARRGDRRRQRPRPGGRRRPAVLLGGDGRPDADPGFDFTHEMDPGMLVRLRELRNYDMVFIDCPGSLEGGQILAAVLAVADFAVIPFMHDPLAVRPTVRTAKFVAEHGVPYKVMLNNVDPRLGADEIRAAWELLDGGPAGPVPVRGARLPGVLVRAGEQADRDPVPGPVRGERPRGRQARAYRAAARPRPPGGREGRELMPRQSVADLLGEADQAPAESFRPSRSRPLRRPRRPRRRRRSRAGRHRARVRAAPGMTRYCRSNRVTDSQVAAPRAQGTPAPGRPARRAGEAPPDAQPPARGRGRADHGEHAHPRGRRHASRPGREAARDDRGRTPEVCYFVTQAPPAPRRAPKALEPPGEAAVPARCGGVARRP